MQVNTKRLRRKELIEFVRMLIAESTENIGAPITDPISLKYIETMQNEAAELEKASQKIDSDEKNQQLIEADRVRDRALSVFRRLMQVYELSEDQSPEAIAYEYLNALWMKKYDPLPYLSLAVETEGIDDLLFDLRTEKYAKHLTTLNLEESVAKIKEANEAFKTVYGENPEENEIKPTFDARILKTELMDTIKQYIDYIKVTSETSDNKEAMQLYKVILSTVSKFNEQLAQRHSGGIVDEGE